MRRPFLHALAAALIAAAAVTVGVAPGVHTALADPLTADPAVAADAGAAWLAATVNDEGFVPGPTDDPNTGATLDAALALAAARTQEPTFRRMVAWLAANVTAAGRVSGEESPGAIGELLMIAVAAGEDPSTFGGDDLVARLGATLGAFEAGLYGATDPTYDGAYRQSLALLGLSAAGAAPPAAAVQWLADQQCDTGAGAVGAWLAYRADITVDCPPPDAGTFSGPDSNSTAAAVQAMAATGDHAAVAAGLAWLHDAQEADGGISFIPGVGSDPNSTTLVIMAAVAGGEDPSSTAWSIGGTSLVASLLAWQVGPPADAADHGGFASPFSAGAPDPFATRQAVWGAALVSFPLPADVFATAPTDPTTTTSTTNTPTTAPAVADASAAVPVTAAAPYAG